MHDEIDKIVDSVFRLVYGVTLTMTTSLRGFATETNRILAFQFAASAEISFPIVRLSSTQPQARISCIPLYIYEVL